jgi:hypothetical protein
MHFNKFIPAVCLILLVGCSTQKKTDADTSQTSANSKSAPAATTSAQAPTASAPASTTSNGRVVKSKDGTIEGEVVGTPAPKSKFAKLQIGMTPAEVDNLIGRSDGTQFHMTGKQFIPFHFGGDTQRLEVFYKHEGQLTFSNTNNFIPPNALVRIEVNPKATGIAQ